MTITKYLKEFVAKYSFITDAKLVNGCLCIYFKDGTVQKHMNIPVRCTKEQVIAKIEKIKKNIKYYEKKKERDKIILDQMKNECGVCYTFGAEKNGEKY